MGWSLLLGAVTWRFQMPLAAKSLWPVNTQHFLMLLGLAGGVAALCFILSPHIPLLTPHMRGTCLDLRQGTGIAVPSAPSFSASSRDTHSVCVGQGMVNG